MYRVLRWIPRRIQGKGVRIGSGLGARPQIPVLCRSFTSITSSKDNDTIYALCSGKDAFQAVKAMTKSASPFPEMRKASLRSILDSQSKELIDRGLVLCFQEGSR